MKKMHLILALVVSLLAIPVWAEPVDINTADADTLAEVMGGCWPDAGYGHRRLPGQIFVSRECL